MPRGQAILNAAAERGLPIDYVFEGGLVGGKRRLTDEDRREAHRLDRQRRAERRARQVADNEEPGVVLPWVIHGDPELDPLLNPDHPVNRRGAAASAVPRTRQTKEKKMSKNTFAVTMKDGAKLLEQMGYGNAAKMNAQALQAALQKLDETSTDADQAKVKDPAGQKLLKSLLLALARGDMVTVATPGSKPVTATAAPAPAATDREKASAKDDEEEDDEEDYDDEEADEDDEGGPDEGPATPARKEKAVGPVKDPPRKPAPAKTQPAKQTPPQSNAKAAPASAGQKKAPAPVKPAQTPQKPSSAKQTGGAKLPGPGRDGRPSVSATVIEVLKKASKNRPVSVDGVVAVLKVKCKDRPVDGMRVTVKDLIGRNLRKRHGLEVKTNGKGGFWLE